MLNGACIGYGDGKDREVVVVSRIARTVPETELTLTVEARE